MSNKKSILTFPLGGIHPADNKLSADKPIETLALPEAVCIPVSQHIGAPSELVVTAGDFVKAGQLIAKNTGFISTNTHSSVSGTIKKISEIIDTTGYPQNNVTIKVEGDEWYEGIDLNTEIKREITLSGEDIRQRILDCGIVGLGGATFPSHVKLSVLPEKNPEYLCINGAECEPYLTSDHRLMLEKGEEIIIGIQIAMKALGVNKTLIGIENNKPDAIENLRKLAPTDSGIEIRALKTQYPQGGERQLVKSLLNREIPPLPRGLPIDVGCVVFNVGTVFAIYEAVQKNKPLVQRVVSVTGKNIAHQANFLARFGTPISQLIDAVGGLPDNAGKILCGGPMMGKAAVSTSIPVTKGISGILIIPYDESRRSETSTCIRCAKCVVSCPLGLQPYLLKKFVEKELWESAEMERVTACCECGCCTYVCPSNIPLSDYLKLGRVVVNKIVQTRGRK